MERGGDVANAWRFVLAPACMVLAYVALVLAGCEFLRRRTAAAGGGRRWTRCDFCARLSLKVSLTIKNKLLF